MAHKLDYITRDAKKARAWSPLDELWKPALIIFFILLFGPALLLLLGAIVFGVLGS